MKILISEKNTISVYQFMEMCGLECSKKDNIKVSHNIMMKKLALRHKSFPNVVVPKKAAFSSINTEDVLKGNIIIVRDDYKNCFPYYKPNMFYDFMFYNNMSKLELEEIRKQILEEYEKEEKEEQTEYKPGYVKYLYKRDIKLIAEEKSYLEEERKKSSEDDYDKVVLYKKRRNIYCRRGFGRR